jgi:hypothetical protein
MAGGDRSALFRRNRNAFKRHFPEIWAAIERISKTVSNPVFDGETPVNIDLGDISLYPDPAPGWTENQIGEYFENPDRLGFEDPAHCNLSPVSVNMLRGIAKYFGKAPRQKASPYPVVDTGFAFVFGIGLGYHLPELIRRKVAHNLVLLEPVPEFVLHSMYAIDWAKIIRDARKKDISIQFIIGCDPTAMVNGIETVIRRCGSTFLDGSYAYLHYYSWPLREARGLLNEKIKVFYLSSGFFEDEILMMRNTYQNLRQWPFHLIERQPRIEQDYPMFVIGSGPSLDRDLPFIKKWRDRAIIFSCGTSIGILLKNGIRPDLHVENENTLPLVKNLQGFKDKYGLGGIRLVATTTLQAEASGLFDRRWFYHRSPLSSSKLLSGGTEPLPYADPLVANSACAVSAYLGFQNIYMFGVDCGRHITGEHHAKDAIYYQDEFEIDPHDRPDAGFEREVPGNFGGQVLTSWSLDLSRRSLTALMQARRLTIINCSDGARIDGARPKVSAAIKLDSIPNQQDIVLSRIEDKLAAFEPGEMLDKIDLQPHADACDKFTECFKELVDEAKRDDKGFWAFEKRIETFWFDDWSEHKGVLQIMGGTYASMVRLGAFAGTRINNRNTRQRFFEYFLDTYLDICLWMAEETKVLLSEMAAGKSELSDVGKRLSDKD